MKLSGRPLLDTRPDHELFVDRVDEIGRIRAALGKGLNCLVVGERGSGKTSLVRALMFEERQVAVPQDGALPEVLYVRGAGAGSASDLLRGAVEALAQYQGDDLTAGSSGASGAIAELGERAGRGSVLMALDDAPAVAGNALFGALRDELWSIDLRWLVTVATTDSATLLRPPADAFFESRVDLAPLPADASMEILRRRMGEAPERLLAEAAAIGGGNPRRLLDVAREFDGDYSKWSEFASAADERERALAALGRPAHMLAAELESLGGASASDDRLLSAMGWTRPRVVQVLAELEAADLVTASSLKSGQGRPKKVYRLVSPAQFRQQRLQTQGPTS